jgi:PAP2 superfamily
MARTNARFLRQLPFAASQLAVWASLYGAYLYVRSLAIQNVGHAFAHAAQLIGVERATGLLQEAHVQHAAASVKSLRVFLDLYYMLGFGPLLGLTLVWLGLRNRAAYRELRTAMLASLGLASFFFVLYPTAPPRLVHGLGVSDTAFPATTRDPSPGSISTLCGDFDDRAVIEAVRAQPLHVR